MTDYTYTSADAAHDAAFSTMVAAANAMQPDANQLTEAQFFQQAVDGLFNAWFQTYGTVKLTLSLDDAAALQTLVAAAPNAPATLTTAASAAATQAATLAPPVQSGLAQTAKA